jgi:hypothetical protein
MRMLGSTYFNPHKKQTVEIKTARKHLVNRHYTQHKLHRRPPTSDPELNSYGTSCHGVHSMLALLPSGASQRAATTPNATDEGRKSVRL